MKVERIRHFAALFETYLNSPRAEISLHLPDVVSNWQAHFDTDPLSLLESYDKSLKSRFSNALWEGSYHSAKSVMKLLIEKDKYFMSDSFRDLMDESKEPVLRIRRFGEHCEEVFQSIAPESKKLNTHYHDNKKTVIIYLACQYPDKYCFWDYDNFSKMMRQCGALQIPAEVETERYFKSMRAIFGIVQKESHATQSWKNLLEKNKIPLEPCLIFMNHFAEFTARHD